MRNWAGLAAVNLAIVMTILSLSATAQVDDQIVVLVSKARNAKGQVGCALYDNAKGFPSDRKRVLSQATSKITDGKAGCTFERVKPGEYAVSVMHDEDMNGELNTKVFGIPTEGWGVSNNVPARRMGPPKYDKAKFKYEGGQMKLSIRLIY